MKRKLILWAPVAALCLLLAACGNQDDETQTPATSAQPEASDAGNSETNAKEDTAPDAATADTAAKPAENADADKTTTSQETEPASDPNADAEVLPDEPLYGAQIDDQCFDVNLDPLGEVRFVSYEPNADKIPFLDVGFTIETGGDTQSRDNMLPGWTEDNIRDNLKFNSVLAVSFPDIEKDGYDDIIIICDYQQTGGNAGSENYTEARIYSGSADGSFTLNREMSDNVNSALAEKTISSIKDFLGIGKGSASAQNNSWAQVYLDYLKAHTDFLEDIEGYELINLDGDQVPELVQVGAYEAVGCMLLSVADGQLQETQLERLYFTYLEGEGLLCNSDGNMDSYYDIVWKMENGRMQQIASGWYGFADYENMQFDDEGDPIYQYFWNEQEMSREEYEAELNSVFDRTREKSYDYESLLSYEETIEYLEGR